MQTGDIVVHGWHFNSYATRQISTHLSVVPSIDFQVRQCGPNVLFLTNVPPALPSCPGSALEFPPSPQHLQKEAAKGHPYQMPEPPHQDVLSETSGKASHLPLVSLIPLILYPTHCHHTPSPWRPWSSPWLLDCITLSCRDQRSLWTASTKSSDATQPNTLQLGLDILPMNIIWISHIMNIWCPYIMNIIYHMNINIPSWISCQWILQTGEVTKGTLVWVQCQRWLCLT